MEAADSRRVFDPDAYLGRLNHPGSVRLTEEGLETLHRAQLHTIPFENFDILLGRGVSLNPAAVFNKLVRRPRGGYCFELNGLFLMALQFFGFEARPLLARVHRDGKPLGRGHQLSLVTIRGRSWVADVGFGSPHFPAPIPLEIGNVVNQDGLLFRLANAGPFGTMVQSLKDDLWQDLYSFDLGHVCHGDLIYGSHYTSTHPDSFFTSTRVAALPFPGGRASLFNHTLRRTAAGVEQVFELADGLAFFDALKTHFGIALDVPYVALPPVRETPKDTGIVF